MEVAVVLPLMVGSVKLSVSLSKEIPFDTSLAMEGGGW